MEVEVGMEPGGGISCLLDDASKKIRKPYTITKSRESWTDQEHEKFLEALQFFTFLPFCVDDASKKIHKLFTITKSKESWTKQEHDKFLETLQLFDRDWKKIEAFVGSKTVIQIRSHAQKYFLKVQKNGSGEHVPPPRPKRKSSQPYPQKAAKSTLITHQAPGVVTTPTSQQESLYPLSAQPCTVFIPPVSAPAGVSAWVHHMTPMGNSPIIANGVPVSEFILGTLPGRDCISSHMGAAHGHVPLPMVPINHGNPETVLQATPDFAEVYGFIGSVFDPNMTGHLRKLKEMAPIDRETVLLLMRNLSINLSSPDFEEHKLFLQVYDVCTIDMKTATESGTEDQTTASCLVSHSDVVDDADSAGEGEVADIDSLDTSQQQVVYPQSPPAEFFPKRGCNTYDGGGAEKNPENNSVSSLPHSTINGEENGNGNENGNENGVLGLSARGLRVPANDEEGIVDLWWS